jgi:hypothetical protein
MKSQVPSPNAPDAIRCVRHAQKGPFLVGENSRAVSPFETPLEGAEHLADDGVRDRGDGVRRQRSTYRAPIEVSQFDGAIGMWGMTPLCRSWAGKYREHRSLVTARGSPAGTLFTDRQDELGSAARGSAYGIRLQGVGQRAER